MAGLLLIEDDTLQVVVLLGVCVVALGFSRVTGENDTGAEVRNSVVR